MLLQMPTNMRTAAVEHRVGRGNGAMLVTGAKMAQQLETATRSNYPKALWFGNHYNPCHNLFLKLAPPGKSEAFVSSPLMTSGIASSEKVITPGYTDDAANGIGSEVPSMSELRLSSRAPYRSVFKKVVTPGYMQGVPNGSEGKASIPLLLISR